MKMLLLLMLVMPLAAQQPGTFLVGTTGDASPDGTAAQQIQGDHDGGIRGSTNLAYVPRPSRLWTVSAVALGAGFAADAATSWGKYEQTPFLRGPDGRYGAKGLVVTGAIAAGVVVAEWLVMRKWPRTRGLFVGLNFGGAAVEGVQAVRNGRVGR